MITPDPGHNVKPDSGDLDEDIWELLAGSAPPIELHDQGKEYDLLTLDGKSSVVEECVSAACFETSETTESIKQKEMELSIIPFGPWQRVGRFPFTLSKSSEASILCMTPFGYHDQLQVTLYDEDCKEVCKTGLVSMADEDWVCLNYIASAGGGDTPSSRLLSCMKDCGHGWSVCFDVKEITEESSICYALRFVRLARSRAALPELDTKEMRQSSTTLCSTERDDCFDCTDATGSFTMAPVIGLRSSMHDVLVRFASSDGADIPVWLLQADFWKSISRGATVQGEAQQGKIALDKDDMVQAISSLQTSGYSRLQSLAWEDVGISLLSLALTMESLSQHGFPPVFIFMYDEPWRLFEKLFQAMAGILGCDAVDMDTSVFAWALRPVGDHGAVGSNFGRPHRDCTYNACHTASGDPNALSVWMPIVPVTVDSGCIYVVPSEHDELFDKPTDPRHMCPDQQMPWAHIQPLPCSAGDVLVWHGNLIHWGSACNRNIAQPRKSIATTFRIASESGKTQSGTLTHAAVRAGLTLQSRLKVIITSLLGYEHWHPGFAGLCGLNEPQG